MVRARTDGVPHVEGVDTQLVPPPRHRPQQHLGHCLVPFRAATPLAAAPRGRARQVAPGQDPPQRAGAAGARVVHHTWLLGRQQPDPDAEVVLELWVGWGGVGWWVMCARGAREGARRALVVCFCVDLC